jgi:denticleless
MLHACKFSPSPGYQYIGALANEKGKVAFQNTEFVRKSRHIQGFQAHGNAVFDICWSPHANKMITMIAMEVKAVFFGTSTMATV